MSSPSASKADIEAEIKLIDCKIKGRIFARDPHQHQQCNDFLQRNPITSLEIPNAIFYDWDKKIFLQAAHGSKVSTFTDLFNFSLAPSTLFASVNCTIEDRLKKTSSRIKCTYTSLKGASSKTPFTSFYFLKVKLFSSIRQLALCSCKVGVARFSFLYMIRDSSHQFCVSI